MKGPTITHYYDDEPTLTELVLRAVALAKQHGQPTNARGRYDVRMSAEDWRRVLETAPPTFVDSSMPPLPEGVAGTIGEADIILTD